MYAASVPENVHLSFDGDGDGRLKGAMWSRLVGMKDDAGKWVGTPVVEGPMPVAIREGEGGTPWAEMEGMIDAAVLAGLEALKNEVADLRKLLAVETLRADNAEAVSKGLQSQINVLQQEKASPALGVLRSSMLGGSNV